MHDDRERRFLPGIELRMAGEGNRGPGTLVGYASVFESPSDVLSDPSVSRRAFREVVKPGAFGKSLAGGADVRCLVDHDPGRVLGRNTAGTLRLLEDRRGLRVECDLPDTTAGRDTAVSVGRRDLTGMSFGFRVRPGGQFWDLSDPENPVRHLTAVDVDDVSVVAYPAYPDTAVALRSLDRAIAEAPAADPGPAPTPDTEPDATPTSTLLARIAAAEAL